FSVLNAKGPFPCEKSKEDEVLCLLTGNSRVRNVRVPPRMILELLTIWLTQTLKKAGFWWFFPVHEGLIGALEAIASSESNPRGESVTLAEGENVSYLGDWRAAANSSVDPTSSLTRSTPTHYRPPAVPSSLNRKVIAHFAQHS